MEPIPVLVDTDIGTSLDDTVCLAFLACHPAIDLVGISTVTAYGSFRAAYARKIIDAYGVDCPVVVGAEAALDGSTMQPTVRESLSALPTIGGGDGAGGFLRLFSKSLDAYGDRLVVLSIGPLTNIAALWPWGDAVPPAGSAVHGKPRLVSMAGSIEGGHEWNVALDPAAARFVLDSTTGPFRNTTVVPIEVTRKLTLDAGEAARRLPHHLTAPFGNLSDHPRHPGKVVLNDPLAALILVRPEVCVYRRGTDGRRSWAIDADAAAATEEILRGVV